MATKPLSLYVHIPFCKSKCSYCDFCSFASSDVTMEAYCDALLNEIALEAPLFKGHTITSLFIGGGTPTILPPKLLDQITQALQKAFHFSVNMEYTLEANPGTLTKEHLALFKKRGINRLSLGAQAFQPGLLSLLGRIHSWQEVATSIEQALAAGITNISVDLMFGLPTQSFAQWKETLDQALRLPVKHLSCYGLIVEEGTLIKKRLEEGYYTLPTEETERKMYDYTLGFLAENGFEQYEISNFAKPGYPCKHNIGYWQNQYYLGLGLAAHSRLPALGPGYAYLRRANTSALEGYILALQKGERPLREDTPISFSEAPFETVMTGLRLTEGLKEADFLAQHGLSLEEAFPNVIAPLVAKGLLTRKNGSIALTRKGMDVQNALLLDFLP